ncbi:hypothetical protein AB0H76_00595 [Nocardia sp. NPDC050712]|uniref:hypothetical protein n=1 Tax=Nocardia sp. NPDC050712 TaxID=3155518 RepID=UPI0033EC0EE0
MKFRRRCAATLVALIAPLSAQATAHAAPAGGFELPNGLWEVPAAAPDSFSLIIAYAFGNRIPAGADPARTIGAPGPVNEALAEAVVRARGDRQIPVYAQIEIAEVLTAKYGMTGVVSIDPRRNPDGTLVYLSTLGVAEQVASLRGAAAETDRAGVVAFGDHLWRATYSTTVRGFAAYAPAGIPMPDRYDPESGQAWTTGPEKYLPVDLLGRAQLLQATGLDGFR